MLKNLNKTRWLVSCAALCAIAVVSIQFIRFPIIPAANYLEYDIADVPIFIGTLLYGTHSGLLITFVVCVLQGLLFSQSSGIIGIIMHFIATGAFVIVCGSFTKTKNTHATRSIALVLGSITMILIMIPLNLIFSSFFAMGVPLSEAFSATMRAFVSLPSNANAVIVAIAGIIAFTAAFITIAFMSKSENKPLKYIAASIAAVVYAFLVMLPLNIVFGGAAFPEAMQGIVPIIWAAVLPFNAIKAGINSVLTFILFAALKRTRFISEYA